MTDFFIPFWDFYHISPIEASAGFKTFFPHTSHLILRCPRDGVAKIIFLYDFS